MQIDWVNEACDTVIGLNGKLARWLNIRGKKYCFILFSINSIYWCARSFNNEMYSQSIFSIVSFLMNIYGLWYWNEKEIGK